MTGINFQTPDVNGIGELSLEYTFIGKWQGGFCEG
jgi:hypothetical protein